MYIYIYIYIYNYRSFLPCSILETISDNSPNFESTRETCENWLSTYVNIS